MKQEHKQHKETTNKRTEEGHTINKIFGVKHFEVEITNTGDRVVDLYILDNTFLTKERFKEPGIEIELHFEFIKERLKSLLNICSIGYKYTPDRISDLFSD